MDEDPGTVRQIESVSALSDPVRRSCYAYVCGSDQPVSRDEAAQGLGVPRHTVKFHLDRLVDAGLLTAEYHRPAGRTGPGAGRPAKYYRRSDQETSVSLPARRYDLAGSVMADAIDQASRTGTDVLDALRDAAAGVGTRLGDQAAARCGDGGCGGCGGCGEATCAVLAEQGYEPHEVDEAGRVELANCPFHALVAQHSELVCTMNLALLDALVRTAGEQTGDERLTARLDPAQGRCCVVLERAVTGAAGAPPDERQVSERQASAG